MTGRLLATLAVILLWAIQTNFAAAYDPFLPHCKPSNEYRTPIAAWTVNTGADGRLRSAPPQRGDKLLYIQLGADNDDAQCAEAPDDKVYTFAFPLATDGRASGERKVHIRGQVRYANFGPACYFSGFYVGEPAAGATEGQTDVNFRPADKFEIMSSGHYCLDGPASGPRPERRSDLPQCKRGDDSRVPIASWSPTLTIHDDLRSRPPEGDGRIVHISIMPGTEQCSDNDGKLFSFGFPRDPTNQGNGGLMVNMRGNAHAVNGHCVLSGYYMNEIVFGINQGWVDTYFGAVDKDRLIASGTYCLPPTDAPRRHRGTSR